MVEKAGIRNEVAILDSSFSLSSPRRPHLARLADPQPVPDPASRIQDGDLITNSGFFDHPTACVQAIAKNMFKVIS